jgi:hypothetical protein
MIAWPLLALSLLPLGCSAASQVDPAFAAGDSGISGRLMRTRLVDGKVQATGPGRGVVLVRGANLAAVAAQAATDDDGNFQIELRPGDYFVYTETQEVGPYGRRVSVSAHRMTHIRLDLPPE